VPAGDVFFIQNSTLLLKGVAIVLLLLGHVSQQCVTGSEALPFRVTGNTAVVIFLFVSGVGLAKKYHLKVNKNFWFKRVKKLALPIWLSLAFIIPLNYLLIGHADPSGQLILNFLGIFWTKFPNSPCWFITYIIFLYAVYFIAAIMPANRIGIKLIILFLLPFIAAGVIIETGSFDHFVLWPQYSLVFPAGVVCGLYAGHFKRYADKLYNLSPILFMIAIFVLLGLYWTGFAVYRISHLVPSELYTQLVAALINPIPFILFLLLFVRLLEMRNWGSTILKFLGRYSFEMYLLHFPFMVYYDFFLFRRPLVFFFFVYGAVVLLLSILLQRVTAMLEPVLFKRFSFTAKTS
jgi:peptidoglycan/LPS O-acetylase OafA/YrhL